MRTNGELGQIRAKKSSMGITQHNTNATAETERTKECKRRAKETNNDTVCLN